MIPLVVTSMKLIHGLVNDRASPRRLHGLLALPEIIHELLNAVLALHRLQVQGLNQIKSSALEALYQAHRSPLLRDLGLRLKDSNSSLESSEMCFAIPDRDVVLRVVLVLNVTGGAVRALVIFLPSAPSAPP